MPPVNMVARTSSNENAHFVLVPLMTQGHIIPMVDMARLLAERGAVVTLVTTPINASRIKITMDIVHLSGLPIRFPELRFPCDVVGLPLGCENLDLITDRSHFHSFFKATSLLREPLLVYLREQQRPPSYVFFDVCTPWAADIARELNIPRMVFHGYLAFSLLCLHNIRQHNLYKQVTSNNEAFNVPGLPQDHQVIQVTKAKAPGIFNSPGWEKFHDEIIEAEMNADGVILNSFHDLESPYVEAYEQALGAKAWAVGPFSLCLKDDDFISKAARGNKASIDEQQCLSWLDTMEIGSVIHASFGSITHMSPAQLIEIGTGLEESGHPFIWVIKKSEMSPEVEQWLKEGFEERVKSRGVVVKGWAPQLMILSHPAVGGFMTHCGWNSVLEAVSIGVQMLTWPHFADQFLNEKLVVDVLKIGITMGIETGMVLVKSDKVEMSVRCLMDQGDGRLERRWRVKELSRMARKAMEGGGSSYENTTLLIEHVLVMQNEKKVLQGNKL
ncbi:hypothetical protein J5N97_004000 [Dioscorea zingiberensis]|uniref:Glycosyltransferase n=1 Tax=Dioscorea zingiberensis TaxID=325984 RepID=A0A9D5D6Y7_9LILI|nr:hypothetical protein J5N97_004000 [Dioscorea zingiberensis]